jgi:hypothetical protein
MMKTHWCVSLAVVLYSAGTFADQQAGAPASAQRATTPSAPTGRVSGRVVAADTGKPLRRVSIMLMELPTKVVRFTETDGDGRYEFARLPPGRYSVRPSKDGFVLVTDDPFANGTGVDLADGDVADGVDFALPRGSVITGRITDEYGDPVAGVVVRAARFQFRPSGQRYLIETNFNNRYMPSTTNDRGEFRIFGLKPGSYYVSAKPDTANAIALAQDGGAGINAVGSDDGLATTYYPGTTNLADAQILRVELQREATAAFSLVPSRMVRISGIVRDAQGRPVSSGAQISLRQTNGLFDWGGGMGRGLGANGEFAFANVAPGEYVLSVRPAPTPGSKLNSLEYASVTVSVGSEDIRDLEVVTRSGISVSGRVTFEGKSEIAVQNLRISAASEEDARNTVGYIGPDGGTVAHDGQFHIPSVFGRVVFRTGFLPQTVMLKSVMLNGVDITNTPLDTTDMDDITGLEVVLVDKQSRIVAYARNSSGEIQYNYRLVTYPAHLKPGDVTVRYQHNTSPNAKGQCNMGRMPPGEYIGLAVKGVQPGEEWDPELRRRIETFGKRFTLKEGETLDIEFPYVE